MAKWQILFLGFIFDDITYLYSIQKFILTKPYEMAKKTTPEITLTTFIDFVNKSGNAKFSVVKDQKKNQDEYSPAMDFYKALREGIIEIHEENLDKSALDNIVTDVTDKKKKPHYKIAVDSYKKFWEKNKLSWFKPVSYNWKVGDLTIKINPELGLEFNSSFLIIKLYFKDDALTKPRATQILSLLESKLRNKVKEEEVLFAVLDVKKGKIFINNKKDTSLMPLIEGEAASFATIWKAIP